MSNTRSDETTAACNTSSLAVHRWFPQNTSAELDCREIDLAGIHRSTTKESRLHHQTAPAASPSEQIGLRSGKRPQRSRLSPNGLGSDPTAPCRLGCDSDSASHGWPAAVGSEEESAPVSVIIGSDRSRSQATNQPARWRLPEPAAGPSRRAGLAATTPRVSLSRVQNGEGPNVQ